jgi:hypothetical protein
MATAFPGGTSTPDSYSSCCNSDIDVIVEYPKDLLTVTETFAENISILIPDSAVIEMEVSDQNSLLSVVVTPIFLV